MTDRTVHASTDAVEVVRYSQRGCWYVEFTEPGRLRRGPITVADAAAEAVALVGEGGTWVQGVAGGKFFDRHMLELVPVAECVLAAAVRAGCDDDEIMWRMFADMAKVTDLIDVPA